MTYREAFTDLIQTLGQLYSDQATIRRIIIQVNLPIEQILFSGRADNTWADVLYKARRHNQVEDIFAVVVAEYPAVSDLHTAVAAYHEAVARGDVPPLPLRRCDFYAHVSLLPNFVAWPAHFCSAVRRGTSGETR